MARAGLKDQTIIPPELLEEIHFRSQGIPRLINAICDNLLLTAFAMESKVATSRCSTKSPPTCGWSIPAGIPSARNRIIPNRSYVAPKYAFAASKDSIAYFPSS